MESLCEPKKSHRMFFAGKWGFEIEDQLAEFRPIPVMPARSATTDELQFRTNSPKKTGWHHSRMIEGVYSWFFVVLTNLHRDLNLD
jgi:hypothetical protein